MGKKIRGGTKQTVMRSTALRKTVKGDPGSSSGTIYQGDTTIAIQGIARDATERKKDRRGPEKKRGTIPRAFRNANDLIYTTTGWGTYVAEPRRRV